MLKMERCFDIAMPRLPTRKVLEETGQLAPRVSVLQEEFEAAAKKVCTCVWLGTKARAGPGADEHDAGCSRELEPIVTGFGVGGPAILDMFLAAAQATR